MTNDISSIIIEIFLFFCVLFLVVRYLFNEHLICQLKYIIYVCLVMFFSMMMPFICVFRPRNPLNIRLSAIGLNPFLRLLGIDYRIENGEVLLNDRPCIVVANHQSSIDFIGMMHLWPKYLRYCTVLAKRELLWAGPFGPSSWLTGVEFIDRKNRTNSNETINKLVKKIQEKSLRLWIFPEGTRHMGETFLPFKLGAFRLAIEAQVPIVPIVFSSYKGLFNVDKSSKSYYWRHGCVTIRCLDPIDTTGMTLENDLQRLTEMTRQRMINAFVNIETMVDAKKKDK